MDFELKSKNGKRSKRFVFASFFYIFLPLAEGKICGKIVAWINF